MQSVPLGPVRDDLPHGGFRELASGIDGLYLSGKFELPAAFKARLEGWKDAAQVEPTIAVLGGVEFSVWPGGLVPGYPFRLEGAENSSPLTGRHAAGWYSLMRPPQVVRRWTRAVGLVGVNRPGFVGGS